VLLPEQSVAEAASTMDRVRLAIQRLAIPTHGGETGVVTVSFGVADLEPTCDSTPNNWIERADAALYRAKGCGRNRVETARPPAKHP
jgi:diguanylate cyclase (GGDEF)-like protein